MESEHNISRLNSPWFYEESSAIELLRSIRWVDGVRCPRCGSADVRDVRTTRSLEVLSCRDCGYNFNSAADTYFHGSKIPVFAQLQFLAAMAVEPTASASRLSRIMRWKTTTVSRQLSKLNGFRPDSFVVANNEYKSYEQYSSAIEYLEQPSISVRPQLLHQALSELLANRGKPLRRGNSRPDRPARVARTPIAAGPHPFIRKPMDVVLPGTREYLSLDETAFNLTNSLRWHNGKVSCPRCNSDYVQQIKSRNPRNLYRCQDCYYMFNSLSGTLFHASKIPIKKHFQFLILQNALGAELKLQDICYAIGCNRITAARLLKRGEHFKTELVFTLIDKRLSDRMRIETPPPESSADPFFLYCEAKGILIYESHFIEYLRATCRTIIS